MSNINDIRVEIVNLLENQVPNTLSSVKELDGRKSRGEIYIDSYPVAFVKPPIVQPAKKQTNKTYNRIHEFRIDIELNKSEVTGPQDVCSVQEDLLDAVDKGGTLSGTVKDLQPTVSPISPNTAQNNTIYFQLIIRAKALNKDF